MCQKLTYNPYIQTSNENTRIFSNACMTLDLAEVQRGWKLLQKPNRLPLLSSPSFVPWWPSIQISTKNEKKSTRRRKINKIIRYIVYNNVDPDGPQQNATEIRGDPIWPLIREGIGEVTKGTHAEERARKYFYRRTGSTGRQKHLGKTVDWFFREGQGRELLGEWMKLTSVMSQDQRRIYRQNPTHSRLTLRSTKSGRLNPKPFRYLVTVPWCRWDLDRLDRYCRQGYKAVWSLNELSNSYLGWNGRQCLADMFFTEEHGRSGMYHDTCNLNSHPPRSCGQMHVNEGRRLPYNDWRPSQDNEGVALKN